MKLLKPKWVKHSGKPTFAIDIHPDGTRFATGGQGDDSGRISIWNMAPVENVNDEKDENIPKMLCLLDNHSGCVNSVRWSNNGRYLASGADDKFVMIWQIGRGFGPSTVFGSSGTVVNIEQWGCVHVLRGHTGDVLDVSWSPDDRFLASGSVDNSIHIWNAEKFPELLTTLQGHQGLVKGVTWDPVGKYFASQSDDKTLKIWRISDWKLESSVTEPFKECGGTTYILRLNWSPDGQYVVSAHALNNGGPVAKIVERDGWKARMDFVGHRKAITCVRFNSRLFTKPANANTKDLKQYACCAIGSRDCTLTIWLTSLKRPLVVIHELFQGSIMDLSWSRCGYRLLVCSLDGTVAFLSFTPEEMGKSMTDQEKLTYHKKTYGTSIVSSRNNITSSIIENPEVLKVHQQQQQQERVRKAMLAQQSRLQSPSGSGKTFLAISPGGMKTNDVQTFGKSGSFTCGTNEDMESAKMILKKQKETRTKDGKRRITPFMLAAPLDVSDSDVMPYGTDDHVVTKVGQEIENPKLIARTMLKSPPHSSPTTPIRNITSPPPVKKLSSTLVPNASQSNVTQTTTSSSTTTTTTASHVPSIQARRKATEPGTNQIPVKRGRKEKEKSKEKQNRDDAFVIAKPNDDKISDNDHHHFARPSSPHYFLQHPKVERSLCVKVAMSVGPTPDEIVYEIQNSLHTSSSHASVVHTLRCTRKEKLSWESFLTSPAIALAGSRDVSKQKATISKESLQHLLKGLSITRTFITQNGTPVLSLSDSSAYSFSSSLSAWIQLTNVEDVLQSASSYSSCTQVQKPTGTLHSIQNPVARLTRLITSELKTCTSKQQTCTISHLENQMCASLSLGSAEEYHFWLMTYARYLVQSGEESKLREICEDLLGPCHQRSDSGDNEAWQNTILVFRKRDLLQEVLPIIASNLRFQRLYTEFKDQLEYINKR
eukprot:gene14352-15848_t